MEGVNPIQRQDLINLKNRLKYESDQEYEFASIEDDEVEEAKLIQSSAVKHIISMEIDRIIYGK